MAYVIADDVRARARLARPSRDIVGTGGGGGFTNQPATDDISIESSAAGDTTQKVTVYGVDGRSSVTVVRSILTLSGTTPVTTGNTTWTTILGITVDAPCVGRLTLKRGLGGGLTIANIEVGGTARGVFVFPLDYRIPKLQSVVIGADGASTDLLGFWYEQHGFATALTGVTFKTVPLPTRVLTKVLFGAVAGGLEWSVYSGGFANDADVAVIIANVEAYINARLEPRFPADVPFTVAPVLVTEIATLLAASILLSETSSQGVSDQHDLIERYETRGETLLDRVVNGSVDIGLTKRKVYVSTFDNDASIADELVYTRGGPLTWRRPEQMETLDTDIDDRI